MDMIWYVGRRVRLLRGEKILSRLSVGRASFKSKPTYRLWFPTPPFWDAQLYITDRRVVLAAHVFVFITQQCNFWFPRSDPSEKSPDVIKTVAVHNVPRYGKCLEIISEDPNPHWYRRPEFRSRFYHAHAENLCQLIASRL